MNYCAILEIELFFSFLVSLSERSQLVHQLVVKTFHLVVFLAGDCLFGPELPMQDSIGVLKLSYGFLEIAVLSLDLIVLLFESRGFLAGEGESLAFGFKSGDGF